MFSLWRHGWLSDHCNLFWYLIFQKCNLPSEIIYSLMMLHTQYQTCKSRTEGRHWIAKNTPCIGFTWESSVVSVVCSLQIIDRILQGLQLNCHIPKTFPNWPTWGPAGADRTQVGPMLAPWTMLSGFCSFCKTRIGAIRPSVLLNIF